MSFFRKHFAAFYSGRAFHKFSRKQYDDAIPLLEKVLKLDPDQERNDIIYSMLGQCYLAAGNYEKAFENLSIAYELCQKVQIKPNDEWEQNNRKNMLEAYSSVLLELGQTQKSIEISSEINKIT